MFKIEGYRFTDKVYEGTHIAIWRGTRNLDNLPVIAKLLKARYPSPQELNRLEHEYAIGEILDIPGVIKYYSIKTVGYGKAIIMEDFGAISLARYIRSHPVYVDIKNALRIVMVLVDIMGDIHRKNIIHKDINPYNILINPETNEVKIIDFSISTQFKKETQMDLEFEKLKGTLAYISPEQTGRMNRSIDYRTDFYSLGVTFYEMLTGKRPFELDGPMELVHAHMAREAIDPHKINNAVPAVVSKIIMKLISKSAEDRYQSAAGLKADLEECYTQLQARGRINDFAIGEKDISDRFLVPEKLYGREKEIRYLMELFNRTAGGKKEMALFSGPPGIGKSALIFEIQRPVTGRRAYFISGKYDQFERNIPYRAIIQAFSALKMQLLATKSSQLEKWKKEILVAVGNNGQVIIDVLPRVELIIGKQPEVPVLPPMETQNRLKMVFRNFIKVFAQEEHPLVLFLDDLQWADNASLQLIDALFEDPGLHYFLLVGAYRDEDVGSTHPLDQMIEKWRTAGEVEHMKESEGCKEIKLKPLDTQMIGQMLADTLHSGEEKVKTLSELVFSKTHGNPFFIHEFLETLQKDSLVEFKEGWRWDVSRIQQADITDNVVELMAGKLNILPANTLAAIKIAACVGVKFPLDMVAHVAGKSVEETFKDLKPAIDEGILLKVGDNGKFSHAKVQEVTCLLTDEREQKELHFKIGKKIWEEPGEQTGETYLFDLANHLNKASELLNEKDKGRLARINLEAGQKAKTSIAYEVAYQFFKQGMELLPSPDKLAWEKDYELVLALYTECGEVGYLTGRYEEAEGFFTAVLENAKKRLDKIKVYEIKLHICTGMQKYMEAVKLCREALNILGFPLPQKASKVVLLKEFIGINVRLMMRKGGVAALRDLPEITDPSKRAIARILTCCMEPAYIAAAEYFPILVFKLLDLTLRNGNSEYSAYAYAVYGTVLCDVLGKIEQGYRFGNLALEMLEKFNPRGLRAKIYFVYGAGVHHWKKHIRGSLEYLQESYKSGAETGDLRYASYSINSYIYRLFFVGEPLLVVKKECNKYYPIVKNFHQLANIQEFDLWYQMVLFLGGDTEDKCLLKGEITDEISFVSQWIAANDMNRLGLYTMVRLILLYLYGHFKGAAAVAEEGKKYMETLVGDIFAQEYYFYYSLAILAHYPHMGKKEQEKHLKQLKKHREKLKKWAAHAPENVQHKYLLIEAQWCWLQGDVGEAVKHYNQSIMLARQYGFIHEEAIAAECAARFYLALGIDEIASTYMRKALYLYGLWGARTKVEDLEGKYPELIADVISKGRETRTGSDDSTAPSLDFNAVMKASQAISGEIVMEKLLGKLIRIMMENAGAQKIVLLLKKGDKLFVEAEGKTDDQGVTVFQHISVEEPHGYVPRSIIRFVERTKEFVMLDDSFRESPFSQDPYIMEQQPRSLLCIPVVHQDTLHAVLYLENKLTPGVFTLEQQETLKVLAAQAAVSLENAMLYDNLTQAEEKVRTILETTNEGFVELDNHGIITEVNPEMCTIVDRTRKSLLGYSFFELLAPEDAELAHHQIEILKLGESSSYKLNLQKPDNTRVHCLVNATPLIDKTKNTKGSFAMITDLTEYEKKDEQLRQAQKMETVGTLAGGLAHDFNNILGGIIGSLSLLQLEMKKKESDPEEVAKYLEDMSKSASRATEIVKHLLALSRKEELRFEPVDLNTTIRHVMNICQNTFDKCIELNFHYLTKPAMVLADPTQLEQILLNLCVNASHAMTIMRGADQRWGGILTVSLEKIYADQVFCENHQGAEKGYYWKLSVQDEGVGMDSETVSKIFEPFFTTKMKTSGTGLGLSMAYSILKQHKGLMDVVSEPGKGSTFAVYLLEFKEMLAPKKKREEEEILKGEGLILVIDDEPIMRKIAVRVLEKAGYTVISAEDGEKGVELFRQHHQELKMVLLDMQMPKKSGKETYLEMKVINPSAKVLLASGSRKDERVEEILRLGVQDFIEKPYTFGQLARVVRKVLAA